MKKKLLLGAVVLGAICIFAGGRYMTTEFEKDTPPNELVDEAMLVVEKPWENGGKAIGEYTWEEFEALSGDQQEAFFEAFESAEAFDAWMKDAKPEAILPVEETAQLEKPWENDSHAVSEYTWEEFQALSGDQQEAFFEAFESAEAFEAWLNGVKPDGISGIEEGMQIEKPWENDGRAVSEYTWEEFQALSGDQQEAFFEAFESAEAFNEWMAKVEPKN